MSQVEVTNELTQARGECRVELPAAFATGLGAGRGKRHARVFPALRITR